MRRRTFLLGFAGFAVAALFWAIPRGPGRPPSVVVITIDTLRPDAIGAGTPALGEFLRNAVSFRAARTVCPLTLPAHVSLFSGLGPERTGIHDNATPLGARDYPLLAEEFRKRGYATAGYVAAPVLARGTGIAAGFDVWGEFEGGGGLPYLPGEERVKEPVRWLRGRDPEKPFFLWVHLYDPHAPYFPFPGDARRPATEGEAPTLRYAGEVRRADAALERLLAAVPAEAIVVLASDHGEGLLEHDEEEHGALCYGSTADCLLAIRAPGLRRGEVDGRPRSLLDVAPTLRALCGLDPSPGGGGSLLEARSEPVVTLSLEAFRVHGWGQCFSASDGRYTLVEHGPSLELFDRREDPAEVRPLDPRGHEAFERLDRAIDRVRLAASPDGAGEYVVSADIPYASGRRPDAALLPRDENARLSDPRLRLGWWRALDAARERSMLGPPAAFREAVASLRAHAAEEPGNPAPPFYLADALLARAMRGGTRDLAEEAFAEARRAVDLGYRTSPALRLLLDAARATGEISHLRAAIQAVSANPHPVDAACVESLYNAALLAASKGERSRLEVAAEAIRRARPHLPTDEARLRCEEILRSLAREGGG